MKKITLISVMLILAELVMAQAPDAFKYQAVVRDNSGNIIQEQAIGVRITILEGSASGTAVYQETHPAETNAYGLISLEIGNGTATAGTFSSIDWGSNSKFLKTEIDPAGGTAYSVTGTSQILSVPYALHAGNAHWQMLGDNIYFNTGNVGLGTTSPTSRLHVTGAVKATSFLGDGSLLTGISGDNLGNHTATQNIKLNGKYLSGDGGNEGIIVTNDGKVGIGTNAPGDAILATLGNINMNCLTGGGVFLRFRESNQHRWSWLYKSWATATFSLFDEVGQKTVMAFEPETGHIGINNTLPEAPLHILGGTDLGLSSGGYLLLGSKSVNNLVMDGDEIMARNNNTTSSLKLNRDGGFVGIGCDGLNTLDVMGTGSPNGGVSGFNEVVGHFKNTGAEHSAVSVDAIAGQDAIIYLAENGTPKWSIRTDVSDGTTNHLEFRDHFINSNQVVFEMRYLADLYRAVLHGSFFPSLTNTYNIGSDYFYWDGIYADDLINVYTKGSNSSKLPFSYGLKDIVSIEPLSYLENKEGKTEQSLELDPQTLAKIVPSAVFEPEDAGGNWGIKYDQLIPVLIKAIQEQQDQIGELKEKVDALSK